MPTLTAMPIPTEVFATGLTRLEGSPGIAVDAEGNVYIANDNKITHITPAGEMSIFAVGGTVVPWQIYPNSMAFNREGILYAASGGAMFHFSKTGQLNMRLTDPFTRNCLASADAIAFDNEDNLYVVGREGQPGIVCKVGVDGTIVRGESDSFVWVGGIAGGIVVDESRGVVFISDGGGNIFRAEKDLRDISLYVQVSSGPGHGLAIDTQGNLYLSAGNQVLRINASDLSVTTCLSFSELDSPSGLAFDSTGRLYIASNSTGRIYRAYGCQP